MEIFWCANQEKCNCKLQNIEQKVLDSNTDKSMEAQLQNSYSVEFHSQSYASFYNTKMEKDKSILTLSVAGIGFLITLANITNSLTFIESIQFFLAACSYLVCIRYILKIFDKNADYIINLTTDNDVSADEITLDKYDSIAVRSFFIALLLSFTLGVSTSPHFQISYIKETAEKTINSAKLYFNDHSREVIQMAKEESNAPQKVQTVGGTSSENFSVKGASKMKPSVSSGQKPKPKEK